MDVVYVTYIVNKWGYQTFSLNTNTYKLALSYVALIPICCFLSFFKSNKMSHFFLVVLYYTMYMPIGTIYSFKNEDTIYFFMVNVIFFILTFFIIFINERGEIKGTNDSTIRIKTKFPYLIKAVTIITVLGMTVQNIKHLDIGATLNLAKVYSVRRNIEYGWGMDYLFSWQTKVLNPYMIAYQHINGNKVKRTIYVLLQLWLYVLTGHKMVLFTLVMLVLIIGFRKYMNKLTVFFVSGMAICFAISLIEIGLQGSSFIIDFFIRRVFYIPALLNFYYYDFFNAHGFQFWKFSLFGRLFGARLDFAVNPSFIIGGTYFKSSNMNAVAGFLGSEYMNGGFIGLLLVTAALIVLLKITDKFAYRLGIEITLATMLTPLYTLWNTSFLTALLTGGVLLAFVLLLFSSTEKGKNKQK